MSKQIPLITRPPIGFVVEGHAEYNCYPSLLHRIVGSKGFRVPCVNPGSFGSIYRNLSRHLSALVLAHHPVEIIVTADFKDAVKEKFVKDCAQLKAHLEKLAKSWLDNEAMNDIRLQPLPKRITVVIQVQKFESWLIADVSSLVRAGYMKSGVKQPSNVDDKIRQPAHWLRQQMKSKKKIKNPKYAKALISQLDPEVMRLNSRSFDKFFREVSSSYNRWSERCYTS